MPVAEWACSSPYELPNAQCVLHGKSWPLLLHKAYTAVQKLSMQVCRLSMQAGLLASVSLLPFYTGGCMPLCLARLLLSMQA
jgi:hypothetical protein